MKTFHINETQVNLSPVNLHETKQQTSFSFKEDVTCGNSGTGDSVNSSVLISVLKDTSRTLTLYPKLREMGVTIWISNPFRRPGNDLCQQNRSHVAFRFPFSH